MMITHGNVIPAAAAAAAADGGAGAASGTAAWKTAAGISQCSLAASCCEQ